MATTMQGNTYFIKISILAIGAFLITVGITPYIFSYLDTEATPEVTHPIEPDGNSSTNSAQVLKLELTETPTREPATNTQVATEVTTVKVESEKTDLAIEMPPLPALHDSDDFLLNEVNNPNTKSLFVPVDIVRNMVVFIDNFSRGEVISRFSPLHKSEEPFTVSQKNGTMVIDYQSYRRYDKYANSIKSLDTEQFIKLYIYLTPLIDEAYQEIGYPAGSFNKTFITAIESVLETPIINYDLAVNSTSVIYQYADESFESLPDTQKLLLRMGPTNLQIVQQKLRNIQNELQLL